MIAASLMPDVECSDPWHLVRGAAWHALGAQAQPGAYTTDAYPY
jgi:hypothetical protein